MTTSSWRRSVTGVACLALALSAAACSSGQDEPGADPTEPGDVEPVDGPIEIAYLQKQGDQQYFVDQADGAKAAAAELGDVTVTVSNLGDDANKAISEVEAAIARGVDGIIIVVPDQAVGPQVISLAREAGIPLMASDDIIVDDAGAEAPFVGFDGTQMGNSVGEEAARLYLEEGWTPENTRILSVYKQDLSVCVDRVDGALDTFAQAVGEGNVPDLIDVGTDNSVTDALDKTAATLTGNQGVTNWVVWGCNDESVTGAVTALGNADVAPANVIGVGLGAYLTCKDWAAGVETGNKSALFISGTDVGSAAVTAMVDEIRNGVPMPAKTIADTHMVDAATWEEAGVVCT